ncbi:MAG: hypothetical protein PWQ59_2210 [Thermoanaerobacterium sp.]|nr:hypothetical protein [Thermoanaerobacterium sp.]
MKNWECADKKTLYDETCDYFKIVFEKKRKDFISNLKYHIVFHGNISLESPIFECEINIGVTGKSYSFYKEYILYIQDKLKSLEIREIPDILNTIDKFENPENDLKILFNKFVF